MNKIFVFLIFGIVFISLISAISQPLIYYKLNLNYNYGNITINSTEIQLSDKVIENQFGFYTAEIKDYNGKLINVSFFMVQNQIFYDTADSNGTINGGGLLDLNQTNFDIFVPYYPNAKEIVIYDGNLTELTRKDISEFSKEMPKINNNIPKGKENQTIATNITQEKFIDSLSQDWWILLIILIVLLIVLFYLVTKKK